MNELNIFSMQSELALAAYGTFQGVTIDIEELTGVDSSVVMSASQADEFVKKWQVAAHYTDPATGASATVFEDKETGVKTLLSAVQS